MKRHFLKEVLHWKGVCATLLLSILFLLATFTSNADAQDQYDPPGRVARLGYMQGAISFEPAGESDWVEAVPNRPMTTGDRLWADRDSRAEVELGSAAIHLSANTGFSFLNLDDRTVQIELSSGTLEVRVRRLSRDDVFEIDTPNQALTAFQPGWYRIEASQDGNYTVVTVREGEGVSTGNGQEYTIHAGQRITLSGTTQLAAEVQQINNPDEFDNWSYSRERRYDDSRSARYCSRDLVGVEDLDDYGDWRSSPEYGDVWFPRVSAGWAPYREGHWAWIDPWGWTWVDDDPWGYAPFHYGRWASLDGRWGWIPGPRQESPVYAPALVAFVGGGALAAGSVAWFPLGPREVYVPSYRVSPTYVNRVNITNTTVNTTTVTNVYNTTIVNRNTTIANANYVNRNVQGGVTAVPQRAFASAQPVARNAMVVNLREAQAAPVSARVAVPPAREAVFGARANTANRVAAPPPALANRTVIAKATPPPPPPPFAARQQVLQSHPGQPVDRAEMQKLRPAAAPPVKQAPPAKPATPSQAVNQPPNRGPAPNAPASPEPGNAANPGNRPEAAPPTPNRPPQPPARNDRPPAAQPENRATPAAPNNRPEVAPPEPNRPPQPPARNDRPPTAEPENRATQPPPSNRPEARPAEPNRPPQPPARNDRPPTAQPENRATQPPPSNRPEARPAEPNRPPQPPARNDRPPTAEPENRPTQPPPSNRPEARPAEPNRPPQPPARNDRPPTAQPENRATQPPPSNRPEARPAEPNRPPQPPARNDRPAAAPPDNRGNPPAPNNRPAANRPTPNQPEARPERPEQPQQTPEERRRQEEQRKQSQPPQ